MTLPKSNVIRLRLTDLEKKDWHEAAGGAGKVSEWIRATCNAAAENQRMNGTRLVNAATILMSKLPPGSVVPVANLKPQVVEDAIAREIQRDVSGAAPDLLSAEIVKDRAHRGSRSMPDAQAGGDDSSSGDRKARAGAKAPVNAQCPRWFHHRAGAYCGACKRVIAK